MMVNQITAKEIQEKIKASGLRPTRQRVAVYGCIFNSSSRHFSVEQIHMELIKENKHISLATIYNNIHQFSAAGLIKELHVDSGKSLYDNNITHHHHFYDEDAGILYDIPIEIDLSKLSKLPKPPKGRKIDRVDIMIRLKPC